VIDVEPVSEAPAADEAPRQDGPAPGLRLKTSHVAGIVGLAIAVVAGIAALILIPWRAPPVTDFPQEVADRLATLDRRLSTLETAAPDGDFAALEARIARLESAEPAAVVAATPEELEDLRGRIAGLDARLRAGQDARAALTARVDTLAASETGKSARAALVALAASALDDAIRGGRGFRDELTLVQRFVPDDTALSALEPFADTGIEPLSRLADDFPRYVADAQTALKAQQEPKTLWDRVSRFFDGFVTVREAGVARNAPAGETLNAMHLALADGDLARAIDAEDDLPEPARAALAPWVARARTHLSALAAARGLRQRVIEDLTATALNPPASPEPDAPAVPPAPPVVPQ